MRKLPSSVAGVPLFVALLGVYPIVFFAGRNMGQFAGLTAALSAAALLIGMGIIYALFSWRSHSKAGSGVAAVFVLVLFFAFPALVSLTGSLMTALKLGSNETPFALDSSPYLRNALAFVWAALAWAFGLRIAKAPWSGRHEVASALTFAGLALLAVGLAPIVLGAASGAIGSDEGTGRSSAAGGVAQTSALRPDIYFIVLDGYARGDILQEYYRFDNHDFLDGLKSRGFRIADKSSSNYNWTFLSISSTLNMGYLQDLYGAQLDPDSRDRTAIYESIRNSAAGQFLKEQGYRIVHFQSTWGATAANPHADQQIKCEHQLVADEFVRSLVEASWLSAFSTKATVDLAQCHLGNFKALTHMGRSPGPKFVFAHFVLPHHPYLFDRNGQVLRNATVSNQFEFQKRLWEDKQGYLGQLEYVNKLVLQAVDGIVKESSQPPIVVLVSDHGPGLMKGLSRKQYAGIRFANLGAYLLPGAPADLMPSNGSAVNQFRRILGYYFDQDLPPLHDHYFQSPYGAPLAFEEVPKWVLRSEWGDAPAEESQAVAATAAVMSQPKASNGE